MPPDASESVVEEVAADMKEDLCDALREPDVQDFFRTLEWSVDGRPPPNPDSSCSDQGLDCRLD